MPTSQAAIKPILAREAAQPHAGQPNSSAVRPTTISSRAFARDIGSAKRAAAAGPVFVTDRGQPAYALLSIAEYHRLAGRDKPSLWSAVADPASMHISFDPPQMGSTGLRVPDFD